MTNSKARFLNGLLYALTLLLTLSGCGLKKREISAGPLQPVAGGDLPSGATYTKSRLYLLRLSTPKLEVHEAYKVSYNVSTLELSPPDEKAFALEIMYWMPDMPGMGQFRTTGKLLSPGRYEAAYEISMGGVWEVQMTLMLNGVPVDSFTYSYNVEE